jgi:flagellar biogenesis protein FliO
MNSLPLKTFIFNILNKRIAMLCMFLVMCVSGYCADSSSISTETENPLKHSEEPASTNKAADEYFPFSLDKEMPEREDEDRFFYQFMKMLGMLGLMVGLMLFASGFLKRLNSTRVEQINTSSHIKIIERRALSNKSSLYLVEVHDKTFVVGESMQGLSLITNFAKPFEFET